MYLPDQILGLTRLVELRPLASTAPKALATLIKAVPKLAEENRAVPLEFADASPSPREPVYSTLIRIIEKQQDRLDKLNDECDELRATIPKDFIPTYLKSPHGTLQKEKLESLASACLRISEEITFLKRLCNSLGFHP